MDKGGYQKELPDIWLTDGNPWEVKRSDIKFEISFGGKVVKEGGKSVWKPSQKVIAQAYDNPIPGYKTPTVGNLRLWDALPVTEFDLTAFNAGDYDKSMLEKEKAECIVAVLYPNDATPEGKELRLKQQYFFVAASIADVLARFKAKHGTKWEMLPDKAVFQMNDTHPTIAVAEVMRVLVDVEGLEWGRAWDISSRMLNYTNHTVGGCPRREVPEPAAAESALMFLYFSNLTGHARGAGEVAGQGDGQAASEAYGDHRDHQRRLAQVAEGQPDRRGQGGQDRLHVHRARQPVEPG